MPGRLAKCFYIFLRAGTSLFRLLHRKQPRHLPPIHAVVVGHVFILHNPAAVGALSRLRLFPAAVISLPVIQADGVDHRHVLGEIVQKLVVKGHLEISQLEHIGGQIHGSQPPQILGGLFIIRPDDKRRLVPHEPLRFKRGGNG